MRSTRVVFAAAALFVSFVVLAQVSEYPPDLPPNFYGIPVDGGRVQAIAVHPTDPRQIITANQFGGLWKTTDGGARWFHLGGLPTVMAVDVAWGSDGRTVIATLSRDNGVNNGGGIWISRDGGGTWSRPATGAPCGNDRIPARPGGYGISFAPDEPRTVYAGTDYGIAISRDHGDTWTHRMLETSSPVAWDRTQNTVRSVLALPGGKVLALSPTGVWRSDDRGATWRNTRAGDFTFWGGFKLMDTLPDDADKVLVLASYDTLLLYEVGTDTYSTIALPGGGSRGPFVRTTRADGGRFDVWVGAGVVLRRATVDSVAALRALTPTSWTSIHRAEGVHDDSGHLGVDSARRPILYGSDGGIFKPANAAATAWTRAGTGATGLNSLQITDLHATSVVRPDGSTASVSLYFATQDNGLWNSSDAGGMWPRADCAEGFFFEGPARVSEGATLTLAYGKVGCGPSGSMFTGADFAGMRAVPDVDSAGAPLANMGQAFFLDTNQWVRYRTPPGELPQVWVSNDNGARWRRRADVSLQIRGVFQSAASAAGRVIFAPFRGLDAPDGTERVGLIRLVDPFAAAQSLGQSDLLYLPDGGSLGVRATEFDWHAVYGVHPRDAQFILAPDIRNGVVKVTRDGGMSWATDAQLTDLVTNRGTLLMYDDQYHMQVTDIAFDPFDDRRIFVATRDAGVMVSNDRGVNWTRIAGSESILYGTGFGFQQDRTVYVSSYGRGLWKIEFPDVRGRIRRIDDLILCAIVDCRIRPFPDPRRRFENIAWREHGVILVQSGRVTDADIDPKGRLRRLFVTPGAVVLRYAPEDRLMPDFKVVESKRAASSTLAQALDDKSPVTGIVLQDGAVAYMISTERELSVTDVEKAVKVAGDEKAPQTRQPYVIITTSVTISGQPILGPDRLLYVKGYDFPPEAKLVARIDGRPAKASLKVDGQGRLEGEVYVPQDLPERLHVVELVDEQQRVVARSTFVIAATDEFEDARKQVRK